MIHALCRLNVVSGSGSLLSFSLVGFGTTILGTADSFCSAVSFIGQGDHAENGSRRQDVYRGARRYAPADRPDAPRQRQPLHRDREAERPKEQRADVGTGAGIAGKVNTNIATPSGLHSGE